MRRRVTGLATRRVGTETVILDLECSRYLNVTGVGNRIFDLLAEEYTLDELVEVIAGEYEVDPEVARRDTAAFVESLRDAGLVEG